MYAAPLPTSTYLLIFLFGPRSLNKVRIQNPQPPVLALLVCAVLEQEQKECWDKTELWLNPGLRGQGTSTLDSPVRSDSWVLSYFIWWVSFLFGFSRQQGFGLLLL